MEDEIDEEQLLRWGTRYYERHSMTRKPEVGDLFFAENNEPISLKKEVDEYIPALLEAIKKNYEGGVAEFKERVLKVVGFHTYVKNMVESGIVKELDRDGRPVNQSIRVHAMDNTVSILKMIEEAVDGQAGEEKAPEA